MATIESYETAGREAVPGPLSDAAADADEETRLQDEAGRPGVRVHGRGREDDRHVRRAQLGMITVGELAPAWLSRKQSDVAPSNYRTLESAWRIHVQPAWGTTRIADVELSRRGAVDRAHGTRSRVLPLCYGPMVCWRASSMTR